MGKSTNSKRFCAVLVAVLMMLQMALIPMVASAEPWPLPPPAWANPASEDIQVGITRLEDAMPELVLPGLHSVLVDMTIVDGGLGVWANAAYDIHWDNQRLEFVGFRRLPSHLDPTSAWPMPRHQMNPVRGWPSPAGMSSLRIQWDSPTGHPVDHNAPIIVDFRRVESGPEGIADIIWTPFDAAIPGIEVVFRNPVRDDHAYIRFGNATLNVIVHGPNPADVSVTHEIVTFTRDNNVFSASKADYATGYVTISHPWYYTIVTAVPAYSRGVSTIEVTMVRRGIPPGMSILSGQVTGVGGAGITGATVIVSTETGTVTTAALTDGYYSIILDPGVVTVAATAPNHAVGFYPGNPVTLVADEEYDNADIALAHMPGAYNLIVTVYGPDENDIVVEIPTNPPVTQVGRMFLVTTTAPIVGDVTASSLCGEFAAQSVPIVYVNNQAIIDITLTDEPIEYGYGRIIGRVTDAGTNQGIVGAAITVFAADGTVLGTASTGIGGVYSIDLPYPATVTVTASASGYLPASATATLVHQAPVTVNFALVAGTPTTYALFVTVTGTTPADFPNIRVSAAGATFAPVVPGPGNLFVAVTENPITGDVTAEAIGFITNTAAAPAYTNNVGHLTINLTSEHDWYDPTVGRVVGQVIDADTLLPIEGATIIVFDANGLNVGTATTNSLGNYIVSNVPVGAVTVAASANNYYPADAAATVIGQADVTVNFMLEPSTGGADVYTLYVTVTGPTVLEDIIVTATGATFERLTPANLFRAVTNAPLTSVTVEALGFETREDVPVPAYVNNVATMTVALVSDIIDPDKGILQGRVTDSVTGEPIGNARVTVYAADGSVLRYGFTNSAGNYRITNIVPGVVTALAEAGGYYAAFYPTTINIVATGPAPGIVSTANFALVPAGYDTYTLTVTVNSANPAIPLVPSATTVVTVAMDGVTFTASPAGNVFVATTAAPLVGIVTATATNFITADITDTGTVPAYVARRAEMTISLDPFVLPPGQGGVDGRVTVYSTDDGIPGVVVTVVGPDGETTITITDDEGFYRIIEGLDPGTYLITVTRPGFESDSRVIEIIADEMITENFSLRPNDVDPNSFVLNVVLRDSSGAFITDSASSTVSLNGEPMAFAANLWTASDLDVAALTGTLRATAAGFWPTYAEVVAGDFDANRVATIVITMCDDDENVEPGVIRGFVRNEANGAGIAGARVTAIAEDNTRSVVTADYSGFYMFTDMAEGMYTMIASAAGFNTAAADVPAILTAYSGANVNIYLAAGPLNNMIVINVEPEDAVETAVVRFATTVLDRGLDGRWTFVTNFAITANVIVTADGFLPYTREISGIEFVDGIATVTVRLTRVADPGVIQGYVIDADTNRRLPGATVRIVNDTTGAVVELTTDAEGFYRSPVLAAGNYTVIAWADGFSVAVSPNSPVTLVDGEPGVNENVFVVASIPGVNDYELIVNVAGTIPEGQTIVVTMDGVTFVRDANANVWMAADDSAMLGTVTATAGFATAYAEVTLESYVNGVAHVVLVLQLPAGFVRFHHDGTYTDVPVILGEAIDADAVPSLAIRYATLREPGQVMMGWFTTSTPDFNITLDIADRPVAFDLSTIITAELLDEYGFLHLYEAWLTYGDVDGDGQVRMMDFNRLQRFTLGAIDYDEIIFETSDVNVDDRVNMVDFNALQRFMLGDLVYLGIPISSLNP